MRVLVLDAEAKAEHQRRPKRGSRLGEEIAPTLRRVRWTGIAVPVGIGVAGQGHAHARLEATIERVEQVHKSRAAPEIVGMGVRPVLASRQRPHHGHAGSRPHFSAEATVELPAIANRRAKVAPAAAREEQQPRLHFGFDLRAMGARVPVGARGR